MSSKFVLRVCRILCVVLLALPFYAGLKHQRIRFHQFEIQRNELRYGTITVHMGLEYLTSLYLSGLNRLLTTDQENSVDFKNIDQMFGYIFKNIPPYAVVYPTETYFYYSFELNGKTIGGNLRFLDAHQGGIHIGYFNAQDPHGETFHKIMTAADGLSINKLSESLYCLWYNNKPALFRVSAIASEPPINLPLLTEEEWVTQIHDESGLRWHLLFNTATDSFYYVLNESAGVTDKFQALHEDSRFLRGERTRFILYNDSETSRKFLVGVSRENIFWNNYFDGPFDQVPPRLPIREKLERAYPYTRYAGGIDAHGNFNSPQFTGSRVAISPYYDYEKIEDLLSYLKRCEKISERSKFWSCLTYEWKKDFHKTLENKRFPVHAVPYSQGWPANHSANASQLWPQAHRRADSLGWPRNHALQDSTTAAFKGTSEINHEHLNYTSQGWPANHDGDASAAWPGKHERGQSLNWPANHIGSLSETTSK